MANVIPNSTFLVTLMMEAIRSSEKSILQEPHGAISQKTAFFIFIAVRKSNVEIGNSA
jgi:hypothetical protein